MVELGEVFVAIKTGIESVAETLFVCSDSDYNQYAMPCKRRTQNGTPLSA
jgi:hypothetical protein